MPYSNKVFCCDHCLKEMPGVEVYIQTGSGSYVCCSVSCGFKMENRYKKPSLKEESVSDEEVRDQIGRDRADRDWFPGD
jgi:hypothetical protein